VIAPAFRGNVAARFEPVDVALESAISWLQRLLVAGALTRARKHISPGVANRRKIAPEAIGAAPVIAFGGEATPDAEDPGSYVYFAVESAFSPVVAVCPLLLRLAAAEDGPDVARSVVAPICRSLLTTVAVGVVQTFVHAVCAQRKPGEATIQQLALDGEAICDSIQGLLRLLAPKNADILSPGMSDTTTAFSAAPSPAAAAARSLLPFAYKQSRTSLRLVTSASRQARCVVKTLALISQGPAKGVSAFVAMFSDDLNLSSYRTAFEAPTGTISVPRFTPAHFLPLTRCFCSGIRDDANFMAEALVRRCRLTANESFSLIRDASDFIASVADDNGAAFEALDSAPDVQLADDLPSASRKQFEASLESVRRDLLSFFCYLEDCTPIELINALCTTDRARGPRSPSAIRSSILAVLWWARINRHRFLADLAASTEWRFLCTTVLHSD
jgi:hypothetical protein